jgi:hypothetical protein
VIIYAFDGIIYTKDEWPLYRITAVWQSIYMTVVRIQDEEDKRLWGTSASVQCWYRGIPDDVIINLYCNAHREGAATNSTIH